MKIIGLLLFTLLLADPVSAQAKTDRFAGKQKTDHTIKIDTVVEAPPEEVYRLWTTEAGIKQFFAPAAHIGDREGGEYTILFVPEKDPQGLSHGTKGARILRLDPGRAIAFEWITFAADANLGESGPPVAPRAIRDVSPPPTWVEIDLEPAGEGRRTLIHFRHYGFKEGELWERSFQWFTRAWSGVLESLKAECAKPKK